MGTKASERRTADDTRTMSGTAATPSAAAVVIAFPLILRDGTVVQVRPIRADDEERLRAFHARLSPDAIRFRFFYPLPVLPQRLLEHLTHLDYTTRMALVATVGTGDQEQIIAVVRYEGLRAGEAEVAFLVEDRWQGHGIATALLYRLAAYARQQGYTTFVAEVLEANHRMREALRMAGFPYTVRCDSGCVEERLDITAPPQPSFAPAALS
jgi:RimJ/RimL family protein N-acetyltransferase